MSRRNLTVLVVALVVGMLCYARSETNPYVRYASRAYRLVDDNALEDPPDAELFAGAVRGMVAVLRSRGDVHSGYLAPQSAAPLRAEMRQEFGGVGVRIGLEGDPPLVVVVERPQPGTPAAASPILPRDVITAIDGRPTTGMGLPQVVSAMRGPIGEPVVLSVLHASGGEEETFSLVREAIRVPSVVGDRRTADGGWRFLLEDAPDVALVRITTFGNRTAAELEECLTSVTELGARAAVLDVRGNAGGALDAAVNVCGLVLREGALVVTTRGRDGDVLEAFFVEGDGPFVDLPVAVLVDGDSASASEIVAAALQDHGRARVYGARTYGKGTVQQLLPLEAGRSLLKLTSASYWRPSGENIHRLPGRPESEAWGVTPSDDTAVELTDDERKAWYAWRRERDLLLDEPAADGDVTEPALPLTADTVLAAAVADLRATLAAGPAAAD